MLFEKDQKRELIRQNQELKRQLEKAKSVINVLHREIEDMKLSLHRYQHQQMYTSPHAPKMEVEEFFSHSSDEEDTNVYSDTGDENEDNNLINSPVVKYKEDKSKQVTFAGKSIQVQKSTTKLIFNSDEDVTRKSIQKLLKKSSERKKEVDLSMDESMPVKSMSTREIPMPLPFFGKEFSLRSEKSLFKKTSNSRPIFQHFFVTGIGKNGPCITYSYPPDQSSDFSGYLALIYGQNYLRSADLSPCNSRTKLNPSMLFRDNTPVTIKKERESFVIPIMKQKVQSSERDYLIICEVQETLLQKHGKQLNNCVFTRYYCFLSQWKFFSELKNLIKLIMDRIQTVKSTRDIKTQASLGILIKEQLEQSLNFLHQKSTDYNKTIDCCIGESGLRFSADVPPFESSFQMVDKYIQSKLYNTTVYVKTEGGETVETKLYGLLLAYGLTEVKIVLYSNNKVRVSESILEFLELIQPLNYVNPIIMSALRQQHQTYLDAPMGLILGLWSETKKSNKQKIEIFMNKKLNLAGLIEKAKLSISEGIVINLDTGLVFGGSLSPELTAIAIKLNNLSLWNKYSKHRRDYYKFVERMLAGRGESSQAKAVWSEFMVHLKKTQLYCYYNQNKEQ